jgi:hypothetical protein
MGLLDKIKNIFTEEVEEDEIKVEQIKKEVRSVPIESPTVEKKEPVKIEKKIEELEDIFEEEEKVVIPKVEKEEPKTPVFFTERDFEDLIEPKRRTEKYEKKERIVEEKKKEEEKPRPYGGNYNTNTIIQREKVTFKPTPIISPVYGVLDKNYHKEDIVDRKETNYESVDGLSVDSIRNKAYGTLEDEIEDVMISESNKKVAHVEDEIDLFDELEKKEKEVKSTKSKEKNVKEIEEATIDLTQELDNLLLSKEKYNKTKGDDDVPTKKEELSESDLFNLIDSMYEEGDED